MPLSWAAEYGSLDVVKTLLVYRANINAINHENSTPLTYMIDVGDPVNNRVDTEAYPKTVDPVLES